MRVLLTGSAGNIGRRLAPLLRQAGYELRTFDRGPRERGDDWEHMIGDLRDILAVRRAVDAVDAVAHLGAVPSDRRSAPEDVFGVNVQGTCHVLQACAEAGVARVVFMSSINALGSFAAHTPARQLPLDDNYPHHPATPYQLSKHLAEEACRCFSDSHGIVTICLRPVGVLDPGVYGRWREFGSGRRAEWGKGDYWSYVDVRDVCDAVLRSLRVEGVKHDAFVLAARDTTMPTPTADLLDAHYPDTPWPGVGRDAYLATDPYRSLVDCSHAADALGWRPEHSWRDS